MAHPLLCLGRSNTPLNTTPKRPESRHIYTRYENSSQTVEIRVQISIPLAHQKSTPQSKFLPHSNRGTCIEASYMPHLITATTTYRLPQISIQLELGILAFPCAFNLITDTPTLSHSYLNTYQLHIHHTSHSHMACI